MQATQKAGQGMETRLLQIGTNACLVAVAIATCSSIIETESIGADDEQGQRLHESSSSSVHCLWPSM